jgi:alpha-galactosidase
MRAISSISHHSDHIVYGVIAVVCSKHRERVARTRGSANTGDRRRFLQLPGVVAGALGIAVLAINVAGASAASPTGGSGPTGRGAASPLAPVPYMGWNTYYGVGGVFDEPTIVSVATSLLDRGLGRAGYRIVWLDFGWASGKRDGRGELLVDRRQWPHGLSWLTRWLHGRHLLAGIYTDAGHSGCRGRGVGSLGHYQQDADRFAAWGFDAVKVDFCGAGQEGLDPRPLYTRFARALAGNSSHRRLMLNVCNFWVPGQIDGTRPSYANSAYATYRWAATIAQSWRTDTDIGFHRNVQWAGVLRNLDRDAAHPAAAGPGHWNDPDYLAPELGMTAAQPQAQLSMWAIVAAPLILGSDPRALSASTISMLENPEVLAVDQDRLGVQGTMIAQRGSAQVWAKPLAGGQVAVTLLNRGAQPVSITTTASQVGLAAARSYRVRDLWAHASVTSSGAIGALVAPDSAVLYRVAAG